MLARSLQAGRQPETSRLVESGQRVTTRPPRRPSVSVPVLSTTIVSTFSNLSSASALRISTPASAPRPSPTMIDIGVARPSAQGQAMISTETAATSAYAKRGSGPNWPMRETRSGRPTPRQARTSRRPGRRGAASGARLRWASATIWTMRASRVSRPTFSARITKLPLLFTVPAMTLSPDCFVDRHRLACDHRLVDRRRALDEHTVDRHLVSRTHAQPIADDDHFERHLLVAAHPRTHRALWRQPSSARMASPVCSRALNSSTWPSRTSTVITAAASK